MSSRLFQEIRERRGLAYSVYSYASSYADAGMFGMAAGTSPAHVSEVAGLMTTELRAIAESGHHRRRAQSHPREYRGSFGSGVGEQ